MMKKRVLIVARLSKKVRGGSQTGLETQDQGVQAWCESQGYEVVDVVADTNSGRVPPWRRKNLKPWVTDPEKIRQYDAVAGYVFDRLSRGNKAETSAIEQWATRHGKQLLTTDGLIFPCEGVEGIRWDVTARIAHEEWLKASERYKRALGYLRDHDFLTNRPPFGFVRVEVDQHKRLVPDENQVPYIKKMRERIMGGEALLSVCRWLDSEEIWAPAWQAWNRQDPEIRGDEPNRRWDPRTLGRFLRNPVLSGRFNNGGATHKVPAIFTDAEHRALLDRLNSHPARRSPVKSEPAFLKGLIFCAKCGGAMYARHTKNQRVNRDGTRFVYHAYRCYGTPTSRSGCGNMVPIASTDAWVDGQLLGSVSFVIEVRVFRGNSHEDDIAAVKRDISELDVEDEKYDARLAELRAELARLRTLPSTPHRVVEEVQPYSVADLWRAMDEPERRAYLLRGGIKVFASRAERWIEGDPARVAAVDGLTATAV